MAHLDFHVLLAVTLVAYVPQTAIPVMMRDDRFDQIQKLELVLNALNSHISIREYENVM